MNKLPTKWNRRGKNNNNNFIDIHNHTTTRRRQLFENMTYFHVTSDSFVVEIFKAENTLNYSVYLTEYERLTFSYTSNIISDDPKV